MVAIFFGFETLQNHVFAAETNTFDPANNQFVISTPADLNQFRSTLGTNYTIYANQTITLANDIDMTGIAMKCDGGSFQGTFDGKNHTIKGYNDNQFGLIPDLVGSGSVSNVHIIADAQNVQLYAANEKSQVLNYGIIANQTEQAKRVSNCWVSGKISVTATSFRADLGQPVSIGAIVGSNGNTILNYCRSDLTISVKNESTTNINVGGITYDGVITNSPKMANLSLTKITTSGTNIDVYGLGFFLAGESGTGNRYSTSFYNKDLIDTSGNTNETASYRGMTSDALKAATTYTNAKWSTKYWTEKDGQYAMLTVFLADKTKLQAQLDAAAGLKQADYTTDSWKVLADAVASATTVKDQLDATQDTVDAQTTAVQSAIAGLKKADTTDLNAAITSAEALTQGDYSADSWAALTTALTSAKKIDQASATQDVVDKATKALTDAQSALVSVKALNEAIAAGDKLKEADYQAASWKTFSDALKAAKAVNQKSADQSTVDAAVKTLTEAQKALVSKVDCTALNAAIASGEKLSKTDYSASSWKTFSDALKAAKAIDTASASQSDVDSAASTLTKAQAALVNVKDLNEAIADASKKKEADYTTTSWKTFKDALSDAKTVAAKDGATQSEADDAAKALISAQKALIDKADGAALKTAIAAAEKLNQADYTAASWKAFSSALAKAEAIDVKDISQTDLDAAVKALTDAQKALTAANPVISYRMDVQGDGWEGWTSDGTTNGTVGQSKAVKAFGAKIVSEEGQAYSKLGISYSVHLSNTGWQSVRSDGTSAGIDSGNGQIEAIRMNLTGDQKDNYSLYYRVHVRNFGWMAWAKDGEVAGTTGYAYRVEAVQAVLVAKGQSPEMTEPASAYSKSSSTAANVDLVVHGQDYGWSQGLQRANQKITATAGTTGQGLRIEAIRLISGDSNLQLHYQAHVQNIGWMPAVTDGQVAGTTGQGLRLEALKIWATGTDSGQYDIQYRAHVQNLGWTDWVSSGNGDINAYAGTTGQGLRIEALQLKIVEK